MNINIKEGYTVDDVDKIEHLTDIGEDGIYRNIGTDWPVDYIMYDKKKSTIYVGQTTNLVRRIGEHQNEGILQKYKFKDIIIIYFKEANKSITENFEKYLIRSLGAEKTNLIMNGNEGSSHDYQGEENYSKEVYDKQLELLWEKLKNIGLVHKNIEEIRKLELYKLSPFVELNKNQYIVQSKITNGIYHHEEIEDIVVNGLPGTGKTILALYLAKEIKNYYKRLHRNKRIAIVTPLNRFNKTLRAVMKKIYTFSEIRVFTPTEIVKEYNKQNRKIKWDILIIDEAHRLKFGSQKMAKKYFREKCKMLKLIKNDNDDINNINQLDWLKKVSKRRIIFFDEFQSIRREDLKAKDLEERVKVKIDDEEKENYFILSEPMRIKVDNYIEYIDNLLEIGNKKYNFDKRNFSPEYELYMTKDLNELEDILKKKPNSRMLAGYAWEWKTKKKQNYNKYYDFEEYYHEGEYTREKIGKEKITFRKKWNKSISEDWCNSEAAEELKEIGCVHTIQGYDVRYAGILFGREIVYRNGKIKVNRKEYKDRGGYTKDMSNEELIRYIKNIYRILMTRGMEGTYIYVFDKELRKYLEKYIYYYKENN